MFQSTVEARVTGFTLVELLVVVAIIALLIAVLLPTLNKARQFAMVAACSSNLHQIHLAETYYVSDNQQWFPVWYGWRVGTWAYIYPDKQYWPNMAAGGQWNANNVYLCPAGVGALDRNANNGNNNITYRQGLNNKRSINWTRQYCPWSAIYSPGVAVLNYCSWWNNSNETQANDPVVIFPNTHPMARPVLYVDGHVETHNKWVDLYPTWPNSDYGIPAEYDDGNGPFYAGWDRSKLTPQ